MSEPYPGTLRGTIEKTGYDIAELETSEDYVHMVVHGAPKMPASYVMKVIKSISAMASLCYYPWQLFIGDLLCGDSLFQCQLLLP